MNIIKVIPQGFCKGVINAINITNDSLINAKKPIYMFGSIVHNSNITSYYNKQGIISIKDLNQITSTSGSIIITAHGVSHKTYQKISSLGLNIIDTTCPSVRHIQELVAQKMDEGYYCLYYGKKNHAECLGVEEDYRNNEHFILIESKDDINKLNIISDKIFFTNQTTMSYFETLELIDVVKEKYPFAIIKEDICNATKQRQLAFIESAKQTDYSIVVGDKMSNNTLSLKNICKERAHKQCSLIENIKDLDDINLSNVNSVSITSGASTPAIIVEEVIKKIKDKNYNSIINDKDYVKTTR